MRFFAATGLRPGMRVVDVGGGTLGLRGLEPDLDITGVDRVIEHIEPAARPAFAAEVRRVARGWFVQTPAWSFPIEPHALLPAAHWLPAAVRRPYWRLGAAGAWEDIRLLRRGELERLFGEPIVAERMGGLVKSWIALRAVDRSA